MLEKSEMTKYRVYGTINRIKEDPRCNRNCLLVHHRIWKWVFDFANLRIYLNWNDFHFFFKSNFFLPESVLRERSE
jgi:hypothetical protein